MTVVKEVAVDMAFFLLMLCLPFAYVVMSAVMSDEISLDAAKASLGKYVEDVREWGLLFKMWAIWIPADTVAFAFIPEHYRIAFVAAVSFFWMIILSTVANTAPEVAADATLTSS